MISKLNDVIGVVLAGGLSQRMKEDKAFLFYQDKPQYQVVFELLQQRTKSTIISANAHQEFELPFIRDSESYKGYGPPSAWYSVYDQCKSALLVIGIDYPLFGEEELVHLISERDNNAIATVLYNHETGFFEPMLGIYEIPFFELLEKEKSNINISIQNLLRSNPTKKVIPLSLTSIQSIDTKEDYIKIKNFINEQ